MSFCEKCGLQYDESREHNFCAKCGFELRKSAPAQQAIPEPSLIQPPSSITQNQPDCKKPVAGIIVALVVGVIGVIWSCAELFHNLYGNLSNVQALLYQAFPALQIKNYIGYSFALLGNAVLVIGALLAHQNHPNGVRVVRVTTYAMIGMTVLLVAIGCFAVFGADAWATLDATTKGAMIGGMIGGIIGAVIQWGLILFLFRNCKSASNISPKKSGGNGKMVIIAVGIILLLVILIACLSGQSNKQANATTETQQITQTTEPAVATPPPTPAVAVPAVQTEEELKFNNEKKLAEGGDATAQFNLGLRYSTQTTFFVVGSKDDAESAKWFSKAADQGFTNAQIEIGRACYFGRGVVEDKNKAVNWFRKAAEQGSVQGELYLGICYKNGDGVPMNADEAVKWLTLAANQNDASAQFELGCCYSEYSSIDYVKKNNVLAYKWLSLAKAQGKQGSIDGKGGMNALEYVAFYLSPEQKAEAQKLAADFVTENGNNQVSQYDTAVYKIIKDKERAESGDVQAALRLGLCYKNGDGVPANADEAVKWLTQAANKNDATAQFELGCCYSEYSSIDYVKKNNVLAYKWLSLAKAQGKQGSIDGKGGMNALEYVAFYLSPEQKAEAQKLAADFVPTK
jgi:TPR repeat protein